MIHDQDIRKLAADFLSEIAPTGLKQMDNLFEHWKEDFSRKQEVNFNMALPPEMRRKILNDIGLVETLNQEAPQRYVSYLHILDKLLEKNAEDLLALSQEQLTAIIWKEGRKMQLIDSEIQHLASVIPIWLKKISKKYIVEFSPANVYEVATPSKATSKRELSFNGIIGKSEKMNSIFACLEKISNSNLSVLIEGESGTGKELIAHAIHTLSNRKNQNFVAVNCGALPDTIIESELFGYEKGAFTGAQFQKKGFFEISNGGTIFLDEITETSLNTQVKLLRVLQEKQFFRLGGTSPVKIDTRIIAATNRNMFDLMRAENFRHDLYYRINEMTITLPPLRERKDDLPLLIDHFITIFAEQNKKQKPEFTPEVLELFQNHSWPGNIRELENVLKRALVLSDGKITINDLPPLLTQLSNKGNYNPFTNSEHQTEEIPQDFSGTFEEQMNRAEKQIILSSLKKNDFNVSKTADQLDVSRRTLQRKIKQYDIEKK